jgi:Disulphide bond corrector protein DsbC
MENFFHFSRAMKFLIAALVFLLVASAGDVRAGAPRVEHKLGGDSTIFSMTLNPKEHPKAGGTFQVTVHVTPGRDWHVYSTKMSTDGGLVPLTLAVPPELADYFEVEKLDEVGDVKTAYDSNFMTVTMAHFTPYDVIATIKVKKRPNPDSAFYLLLHFQTCNETMCMPPRTFEVPMTFLGQPAIKLHFAGVIKRTKLELASLYKPE